MVQTIYFGGILSGSLISGYMGDRLVCKFCICIFLIEIYCNIYNIAFETSKYLL